MLAVRVPGVPDRTRRVLGIAEWIRAARGKIQYGALFKSEEGATVARNKTRDKVGGKADKAKGRIKDATGAATGNESQRTEGLADRAKGTLKNKRGHLKDLVDGSRPSTGAPTWS
jgi:uncharacterized protein YjbJ (UPF0337 family)